MPTAIGALAATSATAVARDVLTRAGGTAPTALSACADGFCNANDVDEQSTNEEFQTQDQERCDNETLKEFRIESALICVCVRKKYHGIDDGDLSRKRRENGVKRDFRDSMLRIDRLLWI